MVFPLIEEVAGARVAMRQLYRDVTSASFTATR
ncbi:hypothetical protein JOE54_002352 [Brachybacterium tyrofermentans]